MNFIVQLKLKTSTEIVRKSSNNLHDRKSKKPSLNQYSFLSHKVTQILFICKTTPVQKQGFINLQIERLYSSKLFMILVEFE